MRGARQCSFPFAVSGPRERLLFSRLAPIFFSFMLGFLTSHTVTSDEPWFVAGG
jgi:hypothetical protein